MYDRRLNVIAYEILHRESDPEAQGHDAVQTILHAGLESLIGDKKLIVQVGPLAMTSSFLDLLPPDKTILAVEPEQFSSPADWDAFNSVLQRGYKTCLNQFDMGVGIPEPLKPVKYIKVNTEDELQGWTRDMLFKAKHPGRRSIALGVQSYDLLQKCWTVGFEYFQGQFVSEPIVVPGRALPQNRSMLFNLLSKLQDPNTKLDALELLVASDVVLSYRLMRLVNSACLGLKQAVDSIRQALMLLGNNRVASMVSMLAMTSMKDKPQELTMTGMIRGKLCEVLAKENKLAEPERFFTLGLLSVLPAMFDLPMSQILEQLPLSKDMAEALGDPQATGEMARILQAVLAYEDGLWHQVGNVTDDPATVCRAYLESLSWAQSALASTAA